MTTTSGRVTILNPVFLEAGRAVIDPLQDFASAVGLNVAIINRHGTLPSMNQRKEERASKQTAEQPTLYIEFWSWPMQKEWSYAHDDSFTRIKTLWDMPLEPGQGDALNIDQLAGMDPFAASDELEIIKSAEGTVAACFYDDTLYVPFDLPHKATRATTDIMTEILLHALPAIQALAARRGWEDCTNVAAWGIDIKMGGAEQLVPLVGWANDKLQRMEAYAKAKAADIALLKNKLKTEEEKLALAEVTVKQMSMLTEKGNLAVRAALRKAIKDLKAMKGVSNVRIWARRISFTVKNVTIEHEGKTYTMGNFRVHFLFEDEFRFVFQPRADNKWFHPHISTAGNLCVRDGSIKTILDAYGASFQFNLVADYIIRALHSYTLGDAYVPIEGFRLGKGYYMTEEEIRWAERQSN